MKILRLILGDQLNSQHSWFQMISDDVLYVMMEIRQETDYARHHVQKVIAFFLAMRHFADERRADGHRVVYLNLDDPANTQSLTQNLQNLITDYEQSAGPIDRFEYLLPDELRLDIQLRTFAEGLTIPARAYDTEHFYTTRTELATYYGPAAGGRKSFVMEFFYRDLRRKHNVLMAGTGGPASEPVTGRWNYDEENRKPLPKNLPILPPKLYKREIQAVHGMLIKQGVQTMGTVDTSHFIWPVTRSEYVEMIQFFCENCLPFFGTYQDAMSADAWSLYHSRLSFGMNSKLISPKEVVRAAVDYFLNHQDTDHPVRVSYAQIEGFVRQILGWREYMRGVYWAKMPEFAQLNYFDHQAKLPGFYWDAKTKANCLHHAIGHSLTYAYSHHIQRLMITGNFALLTGVHPDEVDAWYLGVYIDAIEWVEITNTRGMSQHADGGIVGTKPYVSSAAYINKMSNYCQSCHYDKNKKIADPEPTADSRPPCPFNSLYWDFYDRHRAKLERNQRIGMMYKTWDRMTPEVKEATLKQAQWYKEHVDEI